MNGRSRVVALAAAWALLCGASYTAHREVDRGNAALRAGDADTAAEHYARAAEADPDDPAIPYNLGTARLAAGDLDGAVKTLEGVAGKENKAAHGVAGRAAFNLGNAHLKRASGPGAKADLTAAVDAFRRAVRADPDDEDARRNLQIAATRLRDLPPPPQQLAGGNGEQNPDQGEDKPADKPPDQGQGAGTESKKDPGKDPGKDRSDDPQAGGADKEREASRDRAASGDREGDPAKGRAEGKLPEDMARVLAGLRRQEAEVMRQALRRAMGAPEPAKSGEPDW